MTQESDGPDGCKTEENIWDAAERIRKEHESLQLERYPGELEKLRAYRRNARQAIKALQRAHLFQCRVAENALLRASLAKEKLWAKEQLEAFTSEIRVDARRYRWVEKNINEVVANYNRYVYVDLPRLVDAELAKEAE